MYDMRAAKFGRWLQSANKSPDAVRCVAYLLSETERRGDLEIFISEEVDGSPRHSVTPHCPTTSPASDTAGSVVVP